MSQSVVREELGLLWIWGCRGAWAVAEPGSARSQGYLRSSLIWSGGQ